MKVEIEVDLRPKLPAVRDQGNRPTCLAHATTAAHEQRRAMITWLSAEYLYFFAAAGVSSGLTFATVADTLKGKGQPIDADCPYWTTDLPKGWKPPGRLKVFRRASEEASSPGLIEIEQVIRGEQLPVLGITLTDGFLNPIAPWNIADGPPRARHAITGVGLGRFGGARAVLIRNSWGPDWADGGYAWLDEVFISRHLERVLVLTDEVV